MKKIITVVKLGFLIAASLCAHNYVMAQSSPQINHWVEQLQSSNWRDRQMAASSLINLPVELKTREVKSALIAELEREFERIQKREFEKCLNCDDGDEMGYYTWLFDSISNMKDDQAFALFIRIGVPTALAKYGDKGIIAILEKLDTTTSCNEKYAPIRVLEETLKQKAEGYIAQGKVRSSIKKSMINELDKSKQPNTSVEWYEKRARECANVRVQIVRALSHLAEAGDKEVLPLIKELAENDPYFINLRKNKDDKGPEKKYLVREEAYKFLKGSAIKN